MKTVPLTRLERQAVNGDNLAQRQILRALSENDPYLGRTGYLDAWGKQAVFVRRINDAAIQKAAQAHTDRFWGIAQERWGYTPEEVLWNDPEFYELWNEYYS